MKISFLIFLYSTFINVDARMDAEIRITEALNHLNTTLNKVELFYMHERLNTQDRKIRESLKLTPQRQAVMEIVERKFADVHEVEFSDIETINEKEGIGELLYQSDIVLTRWQLEELVTDNERSRWKRQAFKDHNYPNTIWANGEVYFSYHDNTSDKVRRIFKKGIMEWQKDTCINFFENPTAKERIEVMIDTGCWSYIGNLHRVQALSLGTGCETIGVALHEIGHALGFFHTHSRHDRDQYIIIDKGAVESYAIRQFNKENASRNHNYGVPYDYGSIMHYNSRHFAKDLSAKGRRSMVPIDAGYVDTLGSPFLSFYDKLMMNFHYNCLQICKTKPTEVVKHSPNKQQSEAFNNDSALNSLGSQCGERLWCNGLSGRNSPHAERLSYGSAPLGSSHFGGSPLLASLFSGQGGWGWLGRKFPSIHDFPSSLSSAFGRCIGWEAASATTSGGIIETSTITSNSTTLTTSSTSTTTTTTTTSTTTTATTSSTTATPITTSTATTPTTTLGSSHFGGSSIFASLFSRPGGWGWLGKSFRSIYDFFSSLPSAFGRYVGWKSASASSSGITETSMISSNSTTLIISSTSTTTTTTTSTTITPTTTSTTTTPTTTTTTTTPTTTSTTTTPTTTTTTTTPTTTSTTTTPTTTTTTTTPTTTSTTTTPTTTTTTTTPTTTSTTTTPTTTTTTTTSTTTSTTTTPTTTTTTTTPTTTSTTTTPTTTSTTTTPTTTSTNTTPTTTSTTTAPTTTSTTTMSTTTSTTTTPTTTSTTTTPTTTSTNTTPTTTSTTTAPTTTSTTTTPISIRTSTITPTVVSTPAKVTVKCSMGGFPNPKDCSKCVCPDGYGGRYCDERPSGCGKILKATTDYGHLEDTIGYPGVTNSSEAPDDFLKCNYWIQAPQGRRIEVALVKYNDSVATNGCYLAGIEIKTQKDQRATGYRICSPAYRGWIFRSESNIVPIITYSRVWPTEAVLRYRMAW